MEVNPKFDPISKAVVKAQEQLQLAMKVQKEQNWEEDCEYWWEECRGVMVSKRHKKGQWKQLPGRRWLKRKQRRWQNGSGSGRSR